MLNRGSFNQSLISRRHRKIEEINNAAAKVVDDENLKIITAFVKRPEIADFLDKFGLVLGMRKISNEGGWVEHIKSARQYFRNDEEIRRRDAILGTSPVPSKVYFHDNDLETMLEGALTTTKAKYWDGLFGPTKDYLDGIAAATTVGEVDEVTTTFVLALR
jgi:hypothetical protein